MVTNTTQPQRNTEFVQLLDELTEATEGITNKYPGIDVLLLVNALIVHAMVIYRSEILDPNFETIISQTLAAWKIVDEFEEEGYLYDD